MDRILVLFKVAAKKTGRQPIAGPPPGLYWLEGFFQRAVAAVTLRLCASVFLVQEGQHPVRSLLDPAHYGFDNLGSLAFRGPARHIREGVGRGVDAVVGSYHERHRLGDGLALVTRTAF